MIILGLNAHHADAAACILRDGVPVAAVAEERLSRIKHHAGYPEAAIKECLRLAKLEPGDIDAVAVNRDNRAQIWHKLAYVLRHPPKPGLLLQKLRNRRDWAALPDLLADNNTVTAPLTAIDHHQAHLACARYACPSPADRTVCTVSVDGFGDFTGAAWGATGPFEGTVLAEPQVLGRIRFPHSLGIFYQALTQFLGFPHYGDEYKVMGLAARGTPDPGLTEAVGALVPVDSTGRFSLALGAFRHHRDAVPYEWKGGQPVVGALYAPALSEQLGPARAPEDPMEPRHAALAWAVQSVFEDRLCALLGLAHRDCPTDDLALAGGCAQNSLANGLIAARTPFRRIHIPA
ncbi:MAG: carbamoyltransferase N-terminal domain-containing protein, partial [Rhodospirillaceae bacterium]